MNLYLNRCYEACNRYGNDVVSIRNTIQGSPNFEKREYRLTEFSNRSDVNTTSEWYKDLGVRLHYVTQKYFSVWENE